MNSDDIIKLARDQGCPETTTEGVFRVNGDDLGRLLAAERERCAKMCEAHLAPGIGREMADAIRRME